MIATDAASLKALFRSVGLRSTAARIAAYRTLAEATRPMSHAEVAARLANAGFDNATIFRNLNDLVEVGLAIRTDLGDHVWRFELCGDDKRAHRERHPHFLCTDCGHVSCLPDGSIEVKRKKGVPQALSTGAVIIQVQGLCDACNG